MEADVAKSSIKRRRAANSDTGRDANAQNHADQYGAKYSSLLLRKAKPGADKSDYSSL
jgi:hypothetical protein